MESASSLQACPHCKKEILLSNFILHEVQCVRQNKAQSSHPPPPSSSPIFSSNIPPPPSQLEDSSIFFPQSSFPSSLLNCPPLSEFLPSSILDPVNSNSFLYRPSLIQQEFNIPPHSLSQIDENYRCLDCQNVIPISSFNQHESECVQRKTICPLCLCDFPLPLMESHREQCLALEENSHIHSPPISNPISRNEQSRRILYPSDEIIGELFDLSSLKGLTKEEIDRFPTTTWKEEDFDEEENILEEVEKDGKKCVVCYCEFESGEQVRSLACWHRFHMQCIDKWLGNHSTCPVCKENMKKVLKKGEKFDFESRIN